MTNPKCPACVSGTGVQETSAIIFNAADANHGWVWVPNLKYHRCEVCGEEWTSPTDSKHNATQHTAALTRPKIKPQDILDRMDLRFQSGNDVPVERAHITADEWAQIVPLLQEWALSGDK